MEEKSTEELKKIHMENNKEEWTDEAFAVIRQILEERLMKTEMPAQTERPEPKQPAKDPASYAGRKSFADKLAFALLFVTCLFIWGIIAGLNDSSKGGASSGMPLFVLAFLMYIFLPGTKYLLYKLFDIPKDEAKR